MIILGFLLFSSVAMQISGEISGRTINCPCYQGFLSGRLGWVLIVEINEDFPSLGPVSGTDNAAHLEDVHHTGRSGVAQTQASL